jgi:MFS transporter, DHA1 family, multidrug resistance protein
MALMSSLVALSVDTMLPALTTIGEELGSATANDNQLVISLLFLGMAIAQLVYGPLSDSIGRKPTAYIGFILFLAGTLLCLKAQDFNMLLIGRVVQGIGLGGTRITSMAIVRDQYVGRDMARVMSFIMTIFIIVPIVAPAIGQGILLLGHWKLIFEMLLFMGMVTFAWFYFRQPETLPHSKRHKFSLKQTIKTALLICKNWHVLAYTFTAGLVFGVFMAYLGMAQPILQQLYGLGESFPLYFAAIAASIGLASVINGNLVVRFGMLKITYIGLAGLTLSSIVFAFVASSYDGVPPLWSLMSYFLISLFCVGLLFGNLNALAMEPLGKVAGVGASVVSFLSSIFYVPLAILIGYAYDKTVIPLTVSFAICGAVSLLALGGVNFLAKRKGDSVLN